MKENKFIQFTTIILHETFQIASSDFYENYYQST